MANLAQQICGDAARRHFQTPLPPLSAWESLLVGEWCGARFPSLDVIRAITRLRDINHLLSVLRSKGLMNALPPETIRRAKRDLAGGQSAREIVLRLQGESKKIEPPTSMEDRPADSLFSDEEFDQWESRAADAKISKANLADWKRGMIKAWGDDELDPADTVAALAMAGELFKLLYELTSRSPKFQSSPAAENAKLRVLAGEPVRDALARWPAQDQEKVGQRLSPPARKVI